MVVGFSKESNAVGAIGTTGQLTGLFSGLVNVLLCLFFMPVCGLSVEGATLSTVLANLFSASVLLIKQTKADDWTKISIKKIKLHLKSFKEIFSVGFPSAIQGIISSLSIVIVQTGVLTVNSMYTFPDTAY